MVYLEGGCDTLNVVVPQTLATYAQRPPTIAAPPASALSLAGGPATLAYRLHPALAKTVARWNAGDVAIVNKVGYPDENLSHFESQDIYASAVRAGTAGTLAGLLGDLDDALGVLATELVAQGEWDRTVICVHSEFGRRNYESASQGTDHGGAHATLLLGGAIAGGLYGPDLTEAGLAGVYVPYGVDFRDVLREVLAAHLSIDPARIFPEPQPTNTVVGFV